MTLMAMALALLPFVAAPALGAATASRGIDPIGLSESVGTLYVLVTDPIAHRPVQHAEVSIFPLAPIRPVWSGTTDVNGMFDAGLLPAGSYLVQVRTFIDHARTTTEVIADTRNLVQLEVFSELDP
jgi:hypothetical protein